MKKLILCIFTLLCFADVSKGQIWYLLGNPVSSFVITNEIGDSFSSKIIYGSADTSKTNHLWQIGNTNKPFFSSGVGISRSIMTDTINSYPVKANDWFTIKIPGAGAYHSIITFNHKYQTDSLKDGCIVEFSFDSSAWYNVKGDCNVDGGGFGAVGIYTDSFYKKTDTLSTGEQAFYGKSNGWRQSSVLFFQGFAVRTTGGPVPCTPSSSLFLRFRFVSDTLVDTLDGWMIDSIKIEYYPIGGHVENTNRNKQLSIYPNPSYNGIINFPALRNEQDYTIEIINTVGVKILTVPYKRWIDLSAKPMGLYYYRVSNGEEQYTGHVLRE